MKFTPFQRRRVVVQLVRVAPPIHAGNRYKNNNKLKRKDRYFNSPLSRIAFLMTKYGQYIHLGFIFDGIKYF